MFDADLPWDEASPLYAAMRWDVGDMRYSIQWFESCDEYVFHSWTKTNYTVSAKASSPLAVRAWMYEYKHPSTQGGK